MVGGVLTQILVLLAVACVGLVGARLQIFGPQVVAGLNKLLLYICVPCMVVSSAVGDTAGYGDDVVRLALLTSVGLCAVLPALGWLLSRVLRVPPERRNLQQFLAMCSNFGFMGYPVAQAFFGTGALFLHSLVTICLHAMMFVSATLLLGEGSLRRDWRAFVRELLSPGLLASVAALALFTLQVELPAFLALSLEQVGGITSPLAMMMIGASLVEMRPRDLLLDWRLHVFALLKQLVIPLAAWYALAPVFPNATVLGLAVLVLALPVAAMTVVFAGQYGRDAAYASRAIVVTTVWSFALLPLLGLVIAP